MKNVFDNDAFRIDFVHADVSEYIYLMKMIILSVKKIIESLDIPIENFSRKTMQGFSDEDSSLKFIEITLNCTWNAKEIPDELFDELNTYTIRYDNGKFINCIVFEIQSHENYHTLKIMPEYIEVE